MKKFLLIIVSVMLTLSFVSCGDSALEKTNEKINDALQFGDGDEIIKLLSDDFETVANSNKYMFAFITKASLGRNVEELGNICNERGYIIRVNEISEREFLINSYYFGNDVVEELEHCIKYEDVDFEIDDLRYFSITYVSTTKKTDGGYYIMVKEGLKWKILKMSFKTQFDIDEEFIG